ncbi:S1C family serine protease [Parasediminibacterium sp. JCM 36343]|uniref:S1C family serine protease n=1 Tax=Parasediminibacterium sp. JCM 36343 TaxID=3374279 RepID=UPI00397B71CC
MNEDILMLQAIERYIDGTMLPDERAYFEQLKNNTPEIDQMVVEHSMFLQQIDSYSNRVALKHQLNDIHEKLILQGNIDEGLKTSFKGKVVQMYHKYKKDMAIAASVGGAIALVISGLFTYFSPVVSNSKLQQLSMEFAVIKKNQQVQGSIINEVKSKLPKNASLISGGSGFLIDTKGFIVTNAHVLKGNSAIVVSNDGDEFNADIVFIDGKQDLAILKIKDEDFKAIKALPYSIGKTNIDLGEEIFTLGFPKNDITYTQGYLSSNTGLNGDTATYQIQMNSNPGNSGGPVFNKNGEVIGVLSSRQTQADGVTFAIKSKNLYSLIEELKKEDTTFQKIKLPVTSSVKGKERKTQVKKIEDCVFSVKAYNKAK